MVEVLPETVRRDLARRHLDSAESWLRRLIDLKLSASCGAGYLGMVEGEACRLISKDIRRKIFSRYESDRSRFPRVIDAADLGDAISIILNPELYQRHFRPALIHAFPDGAARTFLNRLEEIRNKLAHGGSCSSRDLERAVCYSNDLADSIKQYFQEANMERRFNAPSFVRMVDNLGNEFHFAFDAEQHGKFVDIRQVGNGTLHVGDELLIEVEVDSSFPDASVHWMTFRGHRGSGRILKLPLTEAEVGLSLDIRFSVKSSKNWHRLPDGTDDMLDLRYRVLPPE